MQIQPVNNKNGTNFGAIKGVKYIGDFKPFYSKHDAKTVYKALTSDAIQTFASHFDFVLIFERGRSAAYTVYDELSLQPVADKPKKGFVNKIKNFTKNLFNNKETQKNDKKKLPCKFSPIVSFNDIFHFDDKISKLTTEDLYKDLNDTLERLEREKISREIENKGKQNPLIKKFQTFMDKLDNKETKN